MGRPNFFLVGAPRCGTTSMYTYLKQHPEIFLSVHKEPHFFGSDLSAMPGTIRDEPSYLALFAGAGTRPCIGEGSVWYLSSKRAPAEIRAFAPAAKILILLRDPVQMAWSLYGLYRRTGNEELATFEAALAAEPERRLGRRIPPGAYFPEGLLYTDSARYAAKVERYFEVFGRDHVCCILFDELVRDTPAVYRKTLEFLGVDPDFAAEFDREQALRRVRLQAIRELRELPPEVRGRIQTGQMKHHESGSPASLPAELEARLRPRFADDVARLGALLGRDLSAWLPASQPSGTRLREILESVRVLKKIPPEIRAKHEGVETLERKFARWQKVRVPDLPLRQREYNDAWPTWFTAERTRIAQVLGASAVAVEHFGSTSVPGLSSKNIIDIAVSLDGSPEQAGFSLAQIGYANYGNSPIDPVTLWFWRIEEDRAFVLHVCDRGRPWLTEQMDLRDFFRTHAEERDRYAQLKRRLADEIDESYLQYTISKMALSIEMIDKAREWRAAGRLEGFQPPPLRYDPAS
ncbi:MAG TPA: hypothetical protein DD490_30610 [Acidobacteria bacterium]|nr:hypothetical protein [Acidobacteriota bacterium]